MVIFFDRYIDLLIKSYPKPEITLGAPSFYLLQKSKQKIPLILQKIAVELPEIIASAKTEPFYDKIEQKQIEVISTPELMSEIVYAFNKICTTSANKP